MNRLREHKTERDDQQTLATERLELRARGCVFVFRWSPGDERVLLKRVHQMADEPNTPLDWFDAALVAYELGRRLARRRTRPASVCTALTSEPPTPGRPRPLPGSDA
jgi:hypothetical protein